MRGHELWWAAALVITTNLGAWGAAALNRSGEPEAVLDLTEHELQLPPKEADNTSLALQLVYARRRESWFDRAKLEAIGFDCSLPVTAENASRYRSQPPRSTFAALEAAADALPEFENAGTNADRLPTHLRPIDVDNDPSALRRRHPDSRRVAVVAATAVLQFIGDAGRPPFLAGRVTSVWPVEINVPRRWMPALEGFQVARAPRDGPPPPRYRVTVKWGRHFEPRIADVQALGSTTPR